MIYKIATKNGQLFGSGCGETVTFKQGFDNIEVYDNQEAFDARIEQLRGV